MCNFVYSLCFAKSGSPKYACICEFWHAGIHEERLMGKGKKNIFVPAKQPLFMRSVFIYPGFSAIAALTLIGCVSSGKFKAMERQARLSDSLYTQSMRTLKTCQDANNALALEKSTLQEQNKSMTLQVTASGEVVAQLRKQLQDLSAVSSAQAESIKRSLDNMGANDAYMMQLHAALSSRDSMNLAMLMYLKQALGGFAEQDVSVKLENGVVDVDISDSLLFNGDSTGYTVGDKAKTVIGRLARAMNDQPDVQVMVEGRWDSLGRPPEGVQDGWDLSVRRATAVVRLLQNDGQVAAMRMTAAGRAEFLPVAEGDSTRPATGNHYTHVIILPQTERLMQLLDRGRGQKAPAAATVPSVSGSGRRQRFTYPAGSPS